MKKGRTRKTMNGLPTMRLRRVTEFIDDNLARALPLADLSAEAHMSQYHFARLFKESTGLPPHRFVVQRRIERARELLAAGQLSIDAIARAVGFRTRSHFSMMFHRLTGNPPTVYRAFAALRKTGGEVRESPGEDNNEVHGHNEAVQGR
jgi:AraC family transcriptional regulator